MGYVGPKDAGLGARFESVGSAQQHGKCPTYTVLLPRKVEKREIYSLVRFERPRERTHLLHGDVLNAPALGYCAASGFHFLMGYSSLSLVQQHR